MKYIKIENKIIKPKKSLGQNFIIDKNIIDKITKITDIYNKKILEIGPGLGTLTDKILSYNPKELIIIEKDKNLYELLLKKYKNKKVKIINEDILNFNFKKINNYKIISNLPYNISSKLLFKLLTLNNDIYEIVCMIQSELATKFDYSLGKMNKYKFISKYRSNYNIKFNVSPNVFIPKPKVNSKVVSFKIIKKKIDQEKLEYFLRFFFINKRKLIKSNKKFANIINNSLVNKRYEDLNYDELLEIYESF